MVTVKLGEMKTTIKALHNIVGKNKEKPALERVGMQITDCGVTIEATDLTTHASIVLGAKGESGSERCGRTSVHIGDLREAVSKQKGKAVKIELEENETDVTVEFEDGMRIQCNGSPEEDIRYPEPNSMPHEHMKTICSEVDAGVLNGALASTLYAKAKDSDHRYTLSGVLLETCENELRIATTDTHRLALSRITSGSMGEKASTIIPSKCAKLLLEVTKALDSSVAIRHDDRGGLVYFSAIGCAVRTREIAGQFPKYMNVMPSERVCVLEVSRKKLAATLKRLKRSASTIHAHIHKLAIEYPGLEGILGLRSKRARGQQRRRGAA